MKPLDWILETGATYVMGVPTHAMDILADMKRRGLSTLGAVKTFYMAGSTIPPETARAFLDMGVKPQNIYGMTENGSHQYTLPDDDAATITSTCGKACAGYETRLWDQESPDREARPGDVGEIGTRGALLMLGYFDNQAATENSFNASGWFMSGDLGRFDENGNLQIVGRKKDLIIRGGHNIHPADIENRALKHPGVLKAAAYPVADVRLGERVCLAVVPREGARLEGMAAARAPACRRAFEIRHARVLHRDGRVPAHRQRQDPEARARGMDEGRAGHPAAGPLVRAGKVLIWLSSSPASTNSPLITLNRPDALNALSFSLIRDLGRVIDEVAQTDARALLVTGAGPKAFCAGADIKELTGRSLVEQKRGAELGQAVFAKIERLPIPSVAVINGYAFGGGLEMALACTSPHRHAQRENGLARDQARLDPRLRRHAAAAARGGRGARDGDDPHRPHRRRRRGAIASGSCSG